MNKPFSIFPLLSAAILAVMATGCVSNVTVTSNDPGALIRYRGHGRPSYRWKTGGLVKKPGEKCTFGANYSSVEVYAIWDEGKPTMYKSEPVLVPLSNWRDPAPIRIDRKR